MHCIIIGSNRCGTTSLYNYLGRHPDVAMARGSKRREVHFFDYAHLYEKGIEWYWKQFVTGRVTLDASPTLIHHQLAPERVKAHVPDCRLIVLMREPVTRAYSNYWLARRKGHTKRTFAEHIHNEAQWLELEQSAPGFWQYYYLSKTHLFAFVDRSLYAKHLEHWLEYFPREQMLLLKSEDFFAQPHATVCAVRDWLGLSQRSPYAYHQWQRAEYKPMSQGMRQKLHEFFREPNQALQELVQWQVWA